jgi:HD-GYP domain-containing protein (c-di-GMP phosphodiesterase class II)
MLRVQTNQARAGACLAADVLHPQRGNVLLKWGFRLDDNIIRKLQDLNIREVWVQYPGTDEIREFISPTILHKRGEVVSLIAEMFQKVQRTPEGGGHVKLPYDVYSRVLRELIEAIVADAAASAYILEMGGSPDSTLRHSAEVCFLSILLGLKLQAYLVNQRKRLPPQEARNVGCLALGAMLHDLGYTLLDEPVRQRYARTGDRSDPHWQNHVKDGHELVSGSIRPAAAGVVMQHHQHYDGTGFPKVVDDEGTERGLLAEEIHVFARIVAVANQFDHLLHPASGESPPRVRVLRQMLSDPLASQFDPVILSALPLVVPAYPPGSIVRLSNGEKAVVVRWYPSTPCQPLVQPLPEDVFENPERHDEVAPAYDLRSRPDLLIVEQDGHDVQGDNFRLGPSPNHDWMSGPTPNSPEAAAEIDDGADSQSEAA